MFELLLLTGLVWLTYYGVLGCGFVSDDLEGIHGYDGKLKKMDYGHLNKWILNKIFGKDPFMNHVFSVLLHNANCILLYLFLSNYIGMYALYTAILFAVHPICAQAVGWISGRGYPISLFFTLLGYNLIASFHQPLLAFNSWVTAVVVLGWCVFYYLAIEAQFATLITFVIMAFLGNYFLAALGLTISIIATMGIITEVIGIRVKAFKAQDLGGSTTLRPQKIVVALKSFYYYTLLCFFPRRLGLYHTYLYHYTDETEREDKYSWRGLGLLILAGIGFWFGSFAVKLGILWWVSYSIIFWNWITIHQMFSERYIYIASIGICILTAVLLVNYPLVFWFVVGLAVMRTWAHLPTFNDEIYFYQSNIWNFPMSEVAFANLGVVYLNVGKQGSAMDMWTISAKINPEYDVPYYNMHSIYKQKGDINNALMCLEKAVNSKVCHFKESWGKELEDLKREIAFANEFNAMFGELVSKNTPESLALKSQLEAINLLGKNIEDDRKQKVNILTQEQEKIKQHLQNLEVEKTKVDRGVTMEELLQKRAELFAGIKQEYQRIKEEGVCANSKVE